MRYFTVPTIKRIALIFVCLTFLSGCTVRIAYAILDDLLMWQLGQYVSLKGEQKKQTKQQIKAFHRWHRKTQLPLYIDYLTELKKGMVAGNITGTYLHQESDKLQDLLDISINQIIPTLTDIAVSLDEKQIQQVLNQLRKEQKEYREDYLDASDEAVQKRRINDVTRYISGFFGPFTDQQKTMLQDWEESLTPHEALMIEQQKEWEKAFLHSMDFRDNRPELEKRIRTVLAFRTDNWDPELQKVLDKNQALTFNMLADLFNSQTPKQRQKLEKKFDQYIRDLEILASKAK